MFAGFIAIGLTRHAQTRIAPKLVLVVVIIVIAYQAFKFHAI